MTACANPLAGVYSPLTQADSVRRTGGTRRSERHEISNLHHSMPHILVIEDDDLFRNLVQRSLAQGGYEVGVGPTVVVVDEGKANTMTTTTAKDDIYAFIFGQKGLMAGLGIQGNKITKINPK